MDPTTSAFKILCSCANSHFVSLPLHTTLSSMAVAAVSTPTVKCLNYRVHLQIHARIAHFPLSFLCFASVCTFVHSTLVQLDIRAMHGTRTRLSTHFVKSESFSVASKHCKKSIVVFVARGICGVYHEKFRRRTWSPLNSGTKTQHLVIQRISSQILSQQYGTHLIRHQGESRADILLSAYLSIDASISPFIVLRSTDSVSDACDIFSFSHRTCIERDRGFLHCISISPRRSLRRDEE